jgi:bacterioferritin
MDPNVKARAGAQGEGATDSGPGSMSQQRDDGYTIDVQKLREDARRHVEQGAVTKSYTANRELVIKMLNEALATELVCVLRYKRHRFVASGIHSEPVAKEFEKHAQEEMDHADRIAERIIQLGGEPDFAPDRLTQRSHAEYSEANGLRTMIEDNLVAERIAVDSYREMIRYLGDRDPTTRRMLEEILAVEEEHAKDMVDLLVPSRESSGEKKQSN